MSALALAAFSAAPLTREPFEFLVLPGFIRAEAQPAIDADYPCIRRPGSFPLSEVRYGPAFAALIDELQGPAMRAAFEAKFQLDLTGRPTMITVRGRCWRKDGRIHTDSATKIITVLIYMNPAWENPGGRLRLLRSAADLEDVLVEVPPDAGTLVAFRRSARSFHGHQPFVGPRRVIQLNWVTGAEVLHREAARHRFSAFLKRLAPRPGGSEKDAGKKRESAKVL